MDIPSQTTPRVVRATTTSTDGTPIGFARLGSGPAVVLVHGSLALHTDWMPVAQLLAPRFTCYVMDRRGRGLSGAGTEPYGIEREYEDIAAVLELAGPDASVLGHSFGAICALGAALQVPFRRLVLYEPPLPAGGPVVGPALEDYRRAVEAGAWTEALHIGLVNFMRVPRERVEAMVSTPVWQQMLPLVPTWVRELTALDKLDGDVSGYAAIRRPVLLLVGSRSPRHPLQDASEALARVLARARVARMEGQGHTAARSAPDVVARLVASFLSESP